MAFQNILVPVDFSDGGRQAILYGCRFARRSRGSIRLLNVVSDPGIYLPDASAPIVMPPMYLNDLRAAAEAGLAQELATDCGEDFTVLREVVVGAPAESIVESACRHGSDLICIGTHGRTGFSRLALGSVAERVVQHSPCPVLAVRAEAMAGSVEIRDVLVAVDFSEFTAQLLHVALGVARVESANVDLVHVLEEWSANRSEFSSDQLIVQDYLQSLRRDAEKRLAGVETYGVKAERHVLIGRPFVELIQHATEHKADLIVIGTHGRTGISHWLLGSVAEMVVRKAHCSVLVIRAPSDKRDKIKAA